MHPLEGIVPVPVSGSLKGVALISPWVTFDTVTSKSFQRNKYKDGLSVEALEEWSSAYRGQAPKNQLFYQEPLAAPPQWWRSVPVQEFLVVAGADEVFVDDICEFANKLMVWPL
jgi:acetyl esterase/lipase